MGQAKRRGTYEERKAQSIERQKAESALRYAEYQKREAARIAYHQANPEARPLRRRGSPLLVSAMLAAALSR